jgi:dynein heavy chain
MRDTVKDVLRKSFDDLARTPRLQWVAKWPGQAVLAVDCMYWTHNTAKAIVRSTLDQYAQQLTDELLQVCSICYAPPSSVEQCTHLRSEFAWSAVTYANHSQ